MSKVDGVILVAGIITPLVLMQVLFAATAGILLILVLYMVYYGVYKAHMIYTHPDRQLLEEIRRQYL